MTLAGSNILAVNSQTTGKQQFSSITTLTTGDVVVTWTDYNSSLPNVTYIKGQVFSASGAPIGSEFTVTDGTQYEQVSSVVATPGGGFAVVWQNYDATGNGDTSVSLRSYDSSGAAQGTQLDLAGIDPNGSTPHIALLSDGSIAVSYTVSRAEPSLGNDVQVALVSNIGKLSQSVAYVPVTHYSPSDTASNDHDAIVSALDSGGFVTAWFSGGSLKIESFDSSGAPSQLGNISIVSSESEFGEFTDQRPSMHSLSDGNVIVMWGGAGSSSGGDYTGIHAVVYSPTGGILSSFTVNQETAGIQSYPSFSQLADGRIIVTWFDENSSSGDGDLSSIKGQLLTYDANTHSLAHDGVEFLVNSGFVGGQATGNAVGDQWVPSVTAVGEGFAISWTDFNAPRVNANNQPSNLADVRVRFYSTGSNSAPVITSPDHATVTAGPNQTAITTLHSTDANPGDVLNWSLDPADTQTFTINGATGALSFVSPATFGDASYDVHVNVTDSSGTKASQILHVSVVDTAPVAVDDYLTFGVDPNAATPTSFNIAISTLLGNDHDAQDTNLTVGNNFFGLGDEVGGGLASNGSVMIGYDNGTQSLLFTYTPDLHYVGPDSFAYTIIDRNGSTSTAIVHLTIKGETPPLAGDDNFDANSGQSIVTGNLFDNDSDAQDGSLSYANNFNGIVVGPQHGSLTDNHDGTFGYVSTSGFVGSDSFIYSIKDSDGQTAQATVTISVAATPDLEITEDDKGDYNFDVTTGGPDGITLSNVTIGAVSSGNLTVAALQGYQIGTAFVDGNGQIAFRLYDNFDQPGIDTLRPGESADITINYELSDGATGTKLIHVTGVEDDPFIYFTYDGTYPMLENQLQAGSYHLVDLDTPLTNISFEIVDADPDLGPDGALFNLDPVIGALTFKTAPDYENPQDSNHDNIYSLSVLAKADNITPIPWRGNTIVVNDVVENLTPVVTAHLNQDTGTSTTDGITRDPTISGMAEPGSGNVYIRSGVNLWVEVPVNQTTGAWSYSLPEGTYEDLTIRQFDFAGNVGIASLGTVIIDQTAPMLESPHLSWHESTQSFDYLSALHFPISTNALSLSGRVTHFDREPATINPDGSISDKSDVVRVDIIDHATGHVVQTAQSGGGGLTLSIPDVVPPIGPPHWYYGPDGVATWSFDASGLSDGVYDLKVSAYDQAGNLRVEELDTVTLDTHAPVVTAHLNQDTGTSTTDGITRDPTISGMAEPGSGNVYIRSGVNLWVEVPVNQTTGAWSYSLPEGTYEDLTIRQFDFAGNVGIASLGTVIIDQTAPVFSIHLNQDTGSSGTDGITSQSTISGAVSDAGLLNVEIWDAIRNVELGEATIDAHNGTWSFGQNLADGSYQLYAKAFDKAGNETDKTLQQTIVVDRVAQPVVISTAGGSVADGGVTINGTGEIGSFVQLYDGNSKLGSAVIVDSTGHWSGQVNLSAAVANHQITAIETDTAGNTATSNAVTFTIQSGFSAQGSTVQTTEDTLSVLVNLSASTTDQDQAINSFRVTVLPPHGTLYLDAAMTQAVVAGKDYPSIGTTLPLYFHPDANFNGAVQLQYVATEANTAPPTAYYLTASGLDGGSTVNGHTHAFEVSGFSIDLSSVITGSVASKPTVSPLKVDLSLNASLNGMLKSIGSGAAIPALELQGVNASNGLVYDLRLGNVHVSKVTDTNGIDHLEFTYDRLSLTQNGQTVSYDLTGKFVTVGTTQLAAPVVATSGGGSAVPTAYYLTASGLDGGSTATGHEHAFKVQNFSFDTSALITNTPAGRPTLSLAVDLASNASLNGMIKSIASGAVLPFVELQGVDANNGLVYDLRLGNVNVSKVTDSNGIDHLEFAYDRYSLTQNGQTISYAFPGGVGTTQLPAPDVGTLGGTTSDPATVTINVTPVNDPAIITGEFTATIQEDGAASGKLLATDIDSAATFAVLNNADGTAGFGRFSMTENGGWTYQPDRAKVDGMNTGEYVRDSIVVHTADGTAATIDVTIVGTSDLNYEPRNGRDSVKTPDNITGTSGNDKINLLAGNDTAVGGAGHDWLLGGDGNDTLYGDTINFNNLQPQATGNDILDGGNGNDNLFGGSGTDLLLGGTGNDLLNGGFGNDVLVGGKGADTFRFDPKILVGKLPSGPGFGNDVITDFENGVDHIDLTGFKLHWQDTVGTFQNGATFAQVGHDVVVTIANQGTITLFNTHISLIDKSDFFGLV